MVFGLNMAAFATGVFEQSMDNARERKAAEIAQAELDAENKKELAKNSMALIQSLVGDDMLSPIQAAEAAKGVKLGIYNEADIYAMAKVVDDIETRVSYSGPEQAYELLVGDNFNMKDLSDYERANLWWNTLNTQLSTSDGRMAAGRFFRNNANADALNLLRQDAAKYEVFARVGWRDKQLSAKKDTGDLETSIDPFRLQENYSFAVNFLEDLGLSSQEDAVRQEIIDIKYDDEKEDVFFFNVTGSDTFGAENEYQLPISKDISAKITKMSQATGYGTAQNLISSFAYTGIYEYDETKTKDEVAFEQNEAIINAAKLFDKYGTYISGQGSDPESNKMLLQDLAVLAGGNRNAIQNKNDYSGVNRDYMTTVLSLMSPVPTDAQFIRPRKNLFASNENSQSKSNLNVQTYVMKKFNITDSKKFDESLQAQRDALVLLDKLSALEDGVESTGAMRELLGFAKGTYEQIKQGVAGAGEVFGVADFFNSGSFFGTELNNPFGDTAAGTDSTSLAGIVNDLNRQGITDINIADLTEIDAIKLTLAAKMARAVDPSGRLSNQDFEIQLRRLGTGSLITKEGIKRNIELLKEEFSRDLAFKSYVSRLITEGSPLTQGAARKIDAYVRLRGYEGETFGGATPYIQAAKTEEPQTNTLEGGPKTDKPLLDLSGLDVSSTTPSGASILVDEKPSQYVYLNDEQAQSRGLPAAGPYAIDPETNTLISISDSRVTTDTQKGTN